MRPFIIWLRRGAGRLMAPALLGFLLVSLFTQPDWDVEFDWATRLTAASVLVVCPVVAAVAAFDTSRRLRPALALLSRASVRARGQVALPALAVTTWAVAAFVVTWLIAAGVVLRHGGVGVTDYWVFPEIVAPLVGAGAVGLATGMLVGPRLAAPLAALVVLATLVVAAPWGRGPFEAQTTYGTLTGLQRPPARSAAVVAGVLVLALAAVLAALEATRPDGARRTVIGLCAVLVAVAAVAPAAWPWKVQVYTFTSEAYGCIGQAPAVCAPRSRLPIMGPVQASLAAAYTTLAGTDFVRPRAFRVTRLDHYAQLDGAAPLDLDPADVRDGRYDDRAVARALVRPHQCLELFRASSAMPLLDDQDVIIPWLVQVLRGHAPARPVPAKVSTAFSGIENCHVMTWNLH